MGLVMYGISTLESGKKRVQEALGLGGRPVGQSKAEAEAIKTDEALRQKKEEKKIEQASVAPEQLVQLDIAESKLNDAIAALEPGQEVDKLTGVPKKFGFNTGGFMGGSGLVPNKFYDMTNNPNYRTLQSTAASEELKNAAQFLKGQGAVSEGERRLLSEMVQLDPNQNRPAELYKKYSQALKIVRKYKNLWRGRTTQGASGGWGEDKPSADIFSQADAIIGGQ